MAKYLHSETSENYSTLQEESFSEPEGLVVCSFHLGKENCLSIY